MSGRSDIEKKVKGLGSYAESISDIENMIEIIDGVKVDSLEYFRVERFVLNWSRIEYPESI